VNHVVVNEGQVETFLKLFRTHKSETTKTEPGNVYYDLYRSRKLARTYVVTERYRDRRLSIRIKHRHMGNGFSSRCARSSRLRWSATTASTSHHPVPYYRTLP
jgi:hypothetical protein